MSDEWKEKEDRYQRGRVIRGEGEVGTPGCNAVMVFEFVFPGDKQFIINAHQDIPDLLTELAEMRAAVECFLPEDWSHITDAKAMREIAEDVAQKDARKWGSLKAELAAKDAEIAQLRGEIEGLNTELDDADEAHGKSMCDAWKDRQNMQRLLDDAIS